MRFAGRLVSGVVKLVVTLLVLAIAVVMVMGAITTQRGWPQTSGTITVAGLHQPVTVARDRYGIIQITAEDRHDLFLAQGYVHAQERMWQMEISRRIGAGRLSELFGKSQVDTDTYIRTLGWRHAAQRDLDAMSAETKAILVPSGQGPSRRWRRTRSSSRATGIVPHRAMAAASTTTGGSISSWPMSRRNRCAS